MTFWILWNLANKWPCDSGFHIPTKNELISFKTAMFNVSGSSTFMNDPTSYQNYLFFPPSYYLNRSTWTLNTQYWPVRLWSCTMTDYQNAYAFYIDENNNIDTKQEKPANWFNIRAFKDEPEQPDSSWTTLYESGQGGIYWNQTKWLISLVSPAWCTTIQDKNVWATTVWQPWDTVDDNNAGLFYQFWNNYWFPYSWATEFYTSTRSLSEIYWPDNPYLDSRFVKVSTSNWFANNQTRSENMRWQQQSWTKILTEPKSISYKLATGIEVWHNTQLWLYSFTQDYWNTWTTIADKDLWANYIGQQWNVFQRWNNHEFPYSGTITTSSTTLNIDNYWPLNPLDSSTYISKTSASLAPYSTTYSTSPYTYWKDLWWWATGTDIAKQGPCDSWRHVPSQAEMNNLLNFLYNLKWGAVYEQDVANWLFLPCAGSLGYGDALPLNQWVTIRYWTSDLYNSSDRRGYFLSNGNGGSDVVIGYTQSSSAFSIRPFSNTAVTPDSTWTKLREYNSYQIRWSESEGIISYTSNSWTTWNSISDKNLWATTVYHSTDTLTSANCWNYYQRWNNYWFPFDGQNITTTTNLVSVWGFWPWNYYLSSNFITPTASPYTWMANPIFNLRWWLGSLTDRRWPCPEGFHIPTASEFTSISRYLVSSTYNNLNFVTHWYLRRYNGNQSSGASRWTCENYQTNIYRAIKVSISNQGFSSTYDTKAMGLFIRPFKDVPVVPSVETGWTRTYQWTATRNINQIYAQWNKVRPPSATKIVLNAYTKTLAVWDTFTLKATLLPEATKDTVTWSSSDTAIATVGSSTGTITGVASGTATITGTTTNWLTATCTVTVTA